VIDMMRSVFVVTILLCASATASGQKADLPAAGTVDGQTISAEEVRNAAAPDLEDAVRVVYLEFPLADIHPEAEKAAEASLCAYEQNKFWELHDAMFGDQRNLSVEELKRKASRLSMDVAAFTACLDEGRYFPEIRADVNEGVKAGIRQKQGLAPFFPTLMSVDSEGGWP
jgi:predicted DsbA family dithiol-disulfide isomerase